MGTSSSNIKPPPTRLSAGWGWYALIPLPFILVWSPWHLLVYIAAMFVINALFEKNTPCLEHAITVAVFAFAFGMPAVIIKKDWGYFAAHCVFTAVTAFVAFLGSSDTWFSESERRSVQEAKKRDAERLRQKIKDSKCVKLSKEDHKTRIAPTIAPEDRRIKTGVDTADCEEYEILDNGKWVKCRKDGSKR